MKTYRIIVFGRVQGVGFRYATLKQAEKLSINGQVQNLEDGSVSIIASGNEENMIQFKSWCKRGPLAASVENTEVKSLEVQYFDHFQIIR